MEGPTGNIFDLKLVGMFYVRGKKGAEKKKESVLTKKTLSNLVFYAQSTIAVIAGRTQKEFEQAFR